MNPSRAVAAPEGSNRQRMLFLQGIEGRETGAGHTPVDIEAQMRRVAAARGQDFESIGGAHGPAAQEAEARARLQKGGISDVQGFSMGGYTANRLRGDYPGVKFDALGATKNGADARFQGVRHLDLPRALADKEEKERLDRDRATLAPAGSSIGLIKNPGALSASADKASSMTHKVDVNGSRHIKVDSAGRCVCGMEELAFS
jgi:hypothetical protein